MKSGIDFFPLDVYIDDSIKLIEAEFGIKGFGVVVRLWQKVYSQGYYLEWTRDVALLFSQDVGEGYNVVSEIINACLRRNIFDKVLYEKYGILTSRGIQKRYFEIAKRRKRVEVNPAYIVIPLSNFNNVYKSSDNVNIFNENDNISKQSKVKESKVKESKGECSEPPTFDLSVIFPNLKINCKPVYDENKYKLLSQKISESKWLAETLKTLSQLHRLADRALADEFKDFKKTATRRNDDGIIKNTYTSAQLNSIFRDLEKIEIEEL